MKVEDLELRIVTANNEKRRKNMLYSSFVAKFTSPGFKELVVEASFDGVEWIQQDRWRGESPPGMTWSRKRKGKLVWWIKFFHIDPITGLFVRVTTDGNISSVAEVRL